MTLVELTACMDYQGSWELWQEPSLLVLLAINSTKQGRDQHGTSPYNIHALCCKQVLRKL